MTYLTRPRLSPAFPSELVPLLFAPEPKPFSKASKSKAHPLSSLGTSIPSTPSNASNSIVASPTPAPSSAPPPPPPTLKYAPRPTPHPQHLSIKTVTDGSHPASGQRSLVARKRLEPKTLLIPYLGIVHVSFTDAEGRRVDQNGKVGEDEHEGSDYDLSLVWLGMSDPRNPFGERARASSGRASGGSGSVPAEQPGAQAISMSSKDTPPADDTDDRQEDNRNSEAASETPPPPLHVSIGVDAAQAGNAARFVNDYRGVAAAPNAEFKLGRGEAGELRMEVWATRRIEKGEEVLVSYGKGWWGARSNGA